MPRLLRDGRLAVKKQGRPSDRTRLGGSGSPGGGGSLIRDGQLAPMTMVGFEKLAGGGKLASHRLRRKRGGYREGSGRPLLAASQLRDQRPSKVNRLTKGVRPAG